MSRQANERRMRALVGQWRSDGGSATAFARSQGVSAAKFGYWRRRLAKRRSAARKAEGIEFHPVRLVEATTPSGFPLEITFPRGERVLAHEGVSAEMLARVISALRS